MSSYYFGHDEVESLFTYRQWTEKEVAKYRPLRNMAKALAHQILDDVPECPERTLAIRALHQCSILVNTAATLHPLDQE